MKITHYIYIFAVAFIVGFGCAHIKPGNDPLVVNAERLETVALSTFDLVIEIDNSNRPFWRTNVSAFHQFAEWLRTPVAGQTNTVNRRGLLMVQNLDNIKQDYKTAKASSNTLYTAIQTLQSTVNQASGWLATVTNTATLHP